MLTFSRGSRAVWVALVVFATFVLGSVPMAAGSSVTRGDLESSLAVAVEQYEALDNRVRALDAATERTERRVRALALRMIDLDGRARRAAVELYKSGLTMGVESLMELDLAQMEETAAYLESSAEFHVAVFQKLAAQRGRLDASLDRLEVAQASAEEARREMAAIQADIRDRLAAARADAALAQEATAIATASPPAPAVRLGPYSADWDAIAQCESGGNWHLDSTYDGGLQFHPLTWLGHGGGQYARYAWQASREEQIAIAEKVLASQGPGAWGSCYQE